MTETRAAGRRADETLRSVVGTIDIDVSDPELLTADEAIRSQYDTSLRRPTGERGRALAQASPWLT